MKTDYGSDMYVGMKQSKFGDFIYHCVVLYLLFPSQSLKSISKWKTGEREGT